jgi:hypothetical protein
VALRGSLRELGIADILQLVKHQSKTGTLKIRSGDDEVSVQFCDGFVIRAMPLNRERKDLLGRMLVRSEMVSEEGLQQALALQKRGGGRLGSLLVEAGEIAPDALKNFVRLQAMETLYRLFLYDHGSYEFVAEPVPDSDSFGALKIEHLLMEGVSQVGEWPALRQVITGYGMSFERSQDLHALMAQEGAKSSSDGSSDDEMDSFFGGVGEGGQTGPLQGIGEHEIKVYDLVTPGRDVQKIIDLTAIGEFETCKILSKLVKAGFIAPTLESASATPSAEPWVGGIDYRGMRWYSKMASTFVAVSLLIGLLFAAPNVFNLSTVLTPNMLSWEQSIEFNELKSLPILDMIRRQLELYRLRHKVYPPNLQALVAARLLDTDLLGTPWHESYYYRQRDAGYVLLRPLH